MLFQREIKRKISISCCTCLPLTKRFFHCFFFLPINRKRYVSHTLRTAGGAFLLLLLMHITFLSSIASGSDEKLSAILDTRQKWTGDFDGMLENRQIRVLVALNKMYYFIDQGRHRGVSVDYFGEFEKFINKKMNARTRKIRILFIPVPRDQLFPALIEGIGDIAAANLTISKKRKELVDFSHPILTGVKEILVTGPTAASVNSIDDISGKELHLRPSSSYHEHIVQLNERLSKKGKSTVKIVKQSPLLEDADLLEMVDAGLIPMAIVDDHKARFWAEIFKKIRLHPEVSIHSDGETGWAFRKNSPKLASIVNAFVKDHKEGTLKGNIIHKRYLKENKWIRNATSPNELKKYKKVYALFRKYADQYNLDYLMTGAVAYQESQFDQDTRSQAGAVGIMQLLPTTAADKNINISQIEKLENNIHAGHKYLRFLQDNYFNDPEIDSLNRNLLTVAAYNAGPAKIMKLRKEAQQRGLDANIWFENVEIVVAEKIGRETVQYVSNIYKYYVSYTIARAQLEARIESGLKEY